MRQIQPLFCEDLLREIDDLLLEIMEDISADDWERKTLYPNWKVRDIFSHIIDTSIRKLSNQRDKYFDKSSEPNFKSYDELINYIENMADNWAIVTRRISPQILLSIF